MVNIKQLIGEADVLLLYNESKSFYDTNFFYASGARDGVYQNSFLVITENERHFVTGNVDKEAAVNTGYTIHIAESESERATIVRKLLHDKKRVGINLGGITGFRYKWIMDLLGDKDLLDLKDQISSVRAIKSPTELKVMRESASIGLEAIENAAGEVVEGITESEVFSNLMAHILKDGAEGIGAGPVVAFGENAADPHHRPTKTKLKKGEVVLIDFGAKFQGYCSDQTRTFFFGEPDDKIQEIYSLVYQASQDSFKAVKDGINGRYIDKVARDVIDSSSYRGRFIHSLGHGVGMEVHDHPAFSPNLDFLIRQGMVVTIEPGIYIPGYGGVRLEDEVIVKADGSEWITECPKTIPSI